MRELDEAARRRLLVWSAVLCAFALGLAPLAGRSSLELAHERTAFAARLSSPAVDSGWKQRPVEVTRDPFVAESAPLGAQNPVDAGIAGTHVTQGAPTGYVVPGAAPVVTAVAIGTSPLALVDDGTHVRVVKVGDDVAGSRVTAIDNAGVRLQNGARLALARDVP